MKYLITVLVIAVLGVGVFVATDQLLLESAEPPTVDEAVEALDADRLSERFDGELAGLTIRPKEGVEFTYDAHCSRPQWEEHRGVEPSYTTGTNIDVPLLPGYEIVEHFVAWCDGRPAFNSVRMTSANEDTSVNVVRVLADPVIHADIPANRVDEVTVNGRPALHVLPIRFDDGLYELSPERVYIVEGFGITNISVRGRADILDIARQITGGAR